MTQTAEQVRAAKERALLEADSRYSTVSHTEQAAMDQYLDSLASVLVMIQQRRMTQRHVDRCAQLLQKAERDLLARCMTSAATAGKRAPAASSIRSGEAA